MVFGSVCGLCLGWELAIGRGFALEISMGYAAGARAPSRLPGRTAEGARTLGLLALAAGEDVGLHRRPVRHRLVRVDRPEEDGPSPGRWQRHGVSEGPLWVSGETQKLYFYQIVQF